MNNFIGKKISTLRKERNLSQQELAEKLNVSNKTISKWECGRGTPDIESLNKLSKIFNITLDEFINSDNKTEIEIEENNSEKIAIKKNYNKKTIISIAVTLLCVLILSILLLCYFFIPRDPRVSDSDIFNIDQNASTLYCSVDNDMDIFSFNESLDVPITNSWSLYHDINGSIEIESKTVNLQIGDSTFYIIVENTAGEKKTYQVTVRRKPLYLVTFNTNGGNYLIDQIVQEGELINYQEPTRDGYIFNGWDYDFLQPITSNITINAKWVAKNLNIYYFANNGTEDCLTEEVIFDSLVSLKSENTFALKGHSLDSWNTMPDGSGVSYPTNEIFTNYNIAEDINLYAQWEINKYNISAEKNINNAGSIIGTGDYDFNTTQIISTSTNDGYTWVGWYDQNDELITTSESLTIILDDYDVKYYAKWTANKYNIALDVNNGNALVEPYKEITFGESFNLPICTRTEATFLGWFDEYGVQYTDENGSSLINWDKPTNTTLVAKYKINEYNVVLNQNTEKGGNLEGSGSKEYGSEVVIIANTNDGYEFAGWYNGQELLTERENFTFIMPNYSLSYTAKWTPIDYTLTLNVNNGNSLDINSQKVTYDSAYTLPRPTRDGYDFGGWYLGEYATGRQLTDSNGNSLIVWDVAEDSTVYAKWNVITYKINYNLNDGMFTTENPFTYTIEDLDIKINNPIRNGYVFEGWIGTGLTEPTKELIITAGSFGDKSYGASWSKSSEFIAISTSSDLLNIANDLNGYYYLTNDINMADIEFTGIGDADNPFTGVLDGCGYKISNLTVDNGMFYNLTGFVYNVNFENAIADSCLITNVNNGKIDQCVIDGNFNHYAVTSSNNGVISNVIVSGEISSTSSGLNVRNIAAGFCYDNNGLIKNSYSTANIISYSTYYTAIGASICVANNGRIENVFATGDIVVRAYTAGIINEVSNSATAIIIKSSADEGYYNCYTSNDVTITTKANLHADEIIRKADGTDISNLQNLDFINFGAYIDENDKILNPDNVWVSVENNLPKLYWMS